MSLKKKSLSEPVVSSPEGKPHSGGVADLQASIQSLRETNHRYHSLIHSSSHLIAILLGEDMIISVANDAMMETWGKGENIHEQLPVEIMPEIICQRFGELLRAVYGTRIPF